MVRSLLRIVRPVLICLPLLAAVPSAGRAAREPHATYAPPAPRAAEVLSAASVARLEREGTSALWVYFTDKGETDLRTFARAVQEAGRSVPDRAQERRARETQGRFVPDYYDVSIPTRYIEAVASTGARIRQVSRWLNAVSVETDRVTAGRIAALPFVKVVEPLAFSKRVGTVGDAMMLPFESPLAGARDLEARSLFMAPALGPPGGYGASDAQMASINSKAAQDSGFTGANVIVGMFDTGFDKAHSATSPLKLIAERDFVYNDGETANQAGEAAGTWNHGTGTWSVLGGYFPNNLVGPAYNASFVLAKTEDVRTETPVEEDNWLAGIEWADSIGADVVSSSLAYFNFDSPSNNHHYQDLDGRTTVVTLAAVLAQRRGIVVANAMANSGPDPGTLQAPADADSILSVGAVDIANALADFSSRGPTYDGRGKPEVVAQGVNTIWAVAGSGTGTAGNNGTSLATPLIGGLAAQVREAHPEWNVSQVRYALKVSGDKAFAPDSGSYGWGRPNVVKAIYGTPLGGPIYPKPFDLLAPVNNTIVTTTSLPITFRWRRSIDPNGDAVTYRLIISRVSPESVVLNQTMPDTAFSYSGYLGPSKTYEWRVEASDPANHVRVCRARHRFTTTSITGIDSPESPSASSRISLQQNRPNPVRGMTHIPFAVAAAPGSGSALATLRIYDASGRLVRTLLEDEPMGVAGSRFETWDGTDASGRRVGSGIYYYRLTAAGKEVSRRMVVLR